MNEALWPEDWQWQEPATAAGTPRLPAPPPAAAPAEAGWSGRGQPKQGTPLTTTHGASRAGCSSHSARPGADGMEVVVATKQHSPFPLGSQVAASVSSQAVLNAMALQLTRPDPEQRLALVADPVGWRLVGRGARQLPRFPAAAGSCSAGVCGAGASAHAGGSPERLGRRAAGRQP